MKKKPTYDEMEEKIRGLETKLCVESDFERSTVMNLERMISEHLKSALARF